MTQYSDARLREELERPKKELAERLGQPVGAFAYPQGDYDERVVEAAKRAGYRTATTVDQGRAHANSDPLRLPRILVSNNTTPAMIRAFVVPTMGPTYSLINFVIKRMLGRKNWPRRKPGDVQSSGTLEAENGADTP